jgi:hypothetical protein
VRLLTDLPLLWVIHSSGASDQHSLTTWLMWCGSNLTMALTLREQAGGRWTAPALVSLGNAAMNALLTIAILVYR